MQNECRERPRNHHGMVWVGSLISEPVLGWLLPISHWTLQLDMEVMEMLRECWLVFPASGNLAIKRTN